MYITQR